MGIKRQVKGREEEN